MPDRTAPSRAPLRSGAGFRGLLRYALPGAPGLGLFRDCFPHFRQQRGVALFERDVYPRQRSAQRGIRRERQPSDNVLARHHVEFETELLARFLRPDLRGCRRDFLRCDEDKEFEIRVIFLRSFGVLFDLFEGVAAAASRV
jgi:hypothetical protein